MKFLPAQSLAIFCRYVRFSSRYFLYIHLSKPGLAVGLLCCQLNMHSIRHVVLWFGLSLSVLGRSPVFGQANTRLTRISTRHGLSQADVKCMVQGPDGFLWIGTRDGLNRYDGHSFRRYLRNSSDSASLGFSDITSLAFDEAGHLWVGAKNGISRFDRETGQFRNFPFQRADDRVTEGHDLFVVDNSRLLVATNHGILAFDAEHGRFFSDPLYADFSDRFVTQFHSSARYGTWVATRTGLFHKMTGHLNWDIYFEGMAANHLNFDGDRVYVSTSRGLYRYGFDSGRMEEVPLPLSQRYVMETLRAANGDLWVACNRVVVLGGDDHTVKYVFSHNSADPFSLSENRAQSLCQTSDGVVWIGTFGYGLNKFNPDFLHFSYLGVRSQPPLSSDYITSVYTANDTILYIGTSRGLNVVDVGSGTARLFFGGADLYIVHTVFGDRLGRIWVATAGGLFEIVAGQAVPAAPARRNVLDIEETADGRLLLATERAGIFSYDKENEPTLLVPPALLPGAVRDLLLTAEGLWVAADDGLRLLTPEGVLLQHFQSGGEGALPSDNVKSVFSDSRGQLWAGTWGGGLARFDPATGQFKSFDLGNGLPSNVVYGLLEDEAGRLWMSTNEGLAVLTDYDRGIFRHFDFSNGLQGNEFNTGAYFESPQGIMYFGGTDGLSFFRPGEAMQPVEVPRVLTTGILVNNVPLNQYGGHDWTAGAASGAVALDWTRNNVGIEFTSVAFKYAEKLRFQYNIGDTVWYNIGDRRSIELIGLPVGRHALQVRAGVPGGGWTTQPLRLSIYISPPFWRTPLFITIVALALLGMVYGVYLLRTRYLRTMNRRLNTLVAERTDEVVRQNVELRTQQRQLEVLSTGLEEKVLKRTREIQLLNEDLEKKYSQLEQFSFITAHVFRGPVARIQGLVALCMREGVSQEELQMMLGYIKTSAHNLDDVIKDLNTILHLKKDSPAEFEPIALAPVLQETLQRLQPQKEEKKVFVDTGAFENLSIRGTLSYVQSIFYHLIENAIKFSGGQQLPVVTVKCETRNQAVRLEFADNGVGIDLELAREKIFKPYQRFNTETSGKGLGLYIVKTQVEILGGAVSVASSPGKGSTFVLTFPH